MSPTAEELLELVNPPDLAIHREKCREITEEVGQKYQRIKKDKELEIQSKKEALEDMEGPIVQQTQEEMNRIKTRNPSPLCQKNRRAKSKKNVLPPRTGDSFESKRICSCSEKNRRHFRDKRDAWKKSGKPMGSSRSTQHT